MMYLIHLAISAVRCISPHHFLDADFVTHSAPNQKPSLDTLKARISRTRSDQSRQIASSQCEMFRATSILGGANLPSPEDKNRVDFPSPVQFANPPPLSLQESSVRAFRRFWAFFFRWRNSLRRMILELVDVFCPPLPPFQA